MFENAPLRFLVFDEAHTYTGARGAEVSVLIRRIRAFCNKGPDDVICIGTSATIFDPVDGDEAARKFANRFFGVDPIQGRPGQRGVRDPDLGGIAHHAQIVGQLCQDLLDEALEGLNGEGDPNKIASVVRRMSDQVIRTDENWRSSLYHALHLNAAVKAIYDTLDEPMALRDATKAVRERLERA